MSNVECSDTRLNKLIDKMIEMAPRNKAAVPIAMSWEAGKWHVYIEVKNGEEWDAEGEGESLADAISAARRSLSTKQENDRRRRAKETVVGIRKVEATPSQGD